jgi:hypothetical protein
MTVAYIDADGIDEDSIAEDDKYIIDSDIIDDFDKAQNSSFAGGEGGHENEEAITYVCCLSRGCTVTCMIKQLPAWQHCRPTVTINEEKMTTTLLAKAGSIFNQIRSHHHTCYM